MSLRDELASVTAYRGETCTVRTFLDGLKPDRAADVEAELASPAWTHAQWHRWAKQYANTHISPETFGRHRKGLCACGRR